MLCPTPALSQLHQWHDSKAVNWNLLWCSHFLIKYQKKLITEQWVTADLAVHHYNLRLDRMLRWRLCCWEGQNPKSMSNTSRELLCALSTKNLYRIGPAIGRDLILLCLKLGFISQLCKWCFSNWFCTVFGECLYFLNFQGRHTMSSSHIHCLGNACQRFSSGFSCSGDVVLSRIENWLQENL